MKKKNKSPKKPNESSLPNTGVYGYRGYLIGEFHLRIQRQESFSLRRFARVLQIHPSILSKILQGRLSVTPTRWVKLKERLKPSPELALEIEAEERLRVTSDLREKWRESLGQVPDPVIIELDRFCLISDWYHFAILELTHLVDFSPTVSYIAKKLRLDEGIAADAVDRLFRLGLLKEKNGKWIDQNVNMSNTSPRITSKDLKHYQKSILQQAGLALEQVSLEHRLQGSVCLAMNSSDLQWARDSIVAFQRSLASELQTRVRKSHANAVYQMLLAVFPLTGMEN